MSQSGTTTGNLKLRSGPGMQFEPPLAFLKPNTALEVLGEDGDWLHVRVNGKEGYVGKKYVNLGNAAVAEDANAAGSMKASSSAPLGHAAANPGGDDKPETSGGMTKRSAPPPPKAGTPGKAHKGVDEK